MGLGRRHARQHETAGFQKNAMDSTVFWEYKPQQQVMTVDGFPGVVTAVYDGPVPGYEEYQVTLDNGLGGGSYTASQLSPLGGTTASHDHEATGLHLASDDYEELHDILRERPPIERMTFSAARSDFDFQHEETDTGGSKFPRRVDMTARHPETGEEAGNARYFPPKRKGGPISIDEVQGHKPGAASALLDEIEHRHPGSSTKFLWEVKRNNNNPDVTGHAYERAGNPSDWDTHYPNVAETIHRGIALKLPSYSARVVNSAGNSKEDHLAEIHSAMPEGPNVGTHWTEDEHAARLFAHNAVSDYRTTIPVVLHADKPARKDLETRQPHLYRGGVFPYGDPHSSENEIPVRRGRGVKVTGISWKPDAPHPDADEHGWLHHTYDEPMHHTASLTAVAYGWDDDEYGDHEEHEEEPRQDWDDILSGVDEIHRGVGVHLHPSIHRIVHDPSRPAAERAHLLLREIAKGDPDRRRSGHGIGTHWTTTQGVAEDFAEKHNSGEVAMGKNHTRMIREKNHMWGTDDEGDPKPQPGTAVVLHAHPDRESVDENPDPFSHGSSDIYDYHSHGEREVPYHPGASVHIKGISWKPMDDFDDHDYTRHDFADGGRYHTAVMEDLTDEDAPEAEPELPPCAYCGSDQMEIAGDNGRAQQAKCQVCGGMMSAPYGLQFKPELIGDPSNHPKDDPDPDSGGVPGAANMRVPVKRMNDSDYTASLHEAGRYEYSSPTGWHYDTSISGKVKMTSPEGESHDVWTHGLGIKQLRHPDDMPTPLYHGTRREIPEGAQIEPGHPGNFVKRMKHVYMADDPEEAAKYAGPYGHVYQVQPTGLYGHRSDAKGASWATEDPVDIVGIHRGPTHRPGEDGKPVQIEGMLHIARTVSWDEIGGMHPHVYGDADIHGEDAEGADGPGIGDAAKYLAFERPGHQDADDHSVDELEFHPMRVHPRHIDFHPSGMYDQRVRNALEGYKTNPDSVPPLVLVKRHNVYQVADGHHRAEAAASLGKSVRAYVAHSPHPDEPFADGEKGPFHGAQPLPKEVQDENNLHAHMQNEHGYAEEQLAGKSDKDIARYHDQKHFDCPAEFRSKMGSRHTAEEDASYRMQHQAPDADYGAPLHDVENMMPDFYNRPHLYNHGQEDFHTSANVIRGARGNPEKKVRIYRALPAEHAGKGFNTGDWVSTSRDYARTHGMANEEKGSKHDWPVISTVVPAKHLHTEGDVHEWAYNGPHQPNASVAFKGGYHQEIRQRADGSIAPVQRKANPFKDRANELKEKGYSFSHYRPGNGDPNHTVVAYDPQENWAGMVKAHENGEVHHVEIEPEHAHEPLEQHMRDMIARETKTGSLHEANERDWCTFRHNARCNYPGPADESGLRLSTPQDRGPCAWDYWQQQVCPISEPGPMALMQAKGSLGQITAELGDALRDNEFRFHFTASWSDVRAKARRLRTEGKVNIVVATNEGVGGEVKGDHHVYETVLTYVPGTYKVGSWECGCKWAAYAWGRSPAYRRFEGRMCSHALAMQFEAQARGMFGKTVEPNGERPKWLRHHTPVVTQYERDTGENLTRRAVPPGNMRRTYEGAHPQVYLRFGKWPEDERSRNNVMGWKEDGVSVYDLDHQGEPKDPDAGMSRWHDHDESCGPDCDLDSYNEEFASNDTGDEMRGRVRRAERNRARGSENPSDTGHLVTGHEVGVGHDGEPLLRNVKRVGDWIDHRHLLVPGAPAHRLARDPEDEDYEPPRTTRRASLDVEGVYGDDHALDLAHPPVYAQVIEQLPEIGPVDSMKWMAALGMTHAVARAVLKDASAELATGELHFEASLRLLAEEGEHEEAEKKRCPDCGAMISANDEKCPHCHHVFSKHEHHHGAKEPAEGDLMSRGMVIGDNWDRDAVHRMIGGTATAHDFLPHIDRSDVGDFWYAHDPHLSHEDNISGAKDFARSERSEHPANDLDRDRPIGETGVVLVGRKPEGWDPENNPDHGLMGNSYIPHSTDVPLHKIHYRDHNGDWHSADATGHSVHVVGGGYDHLASLGAKDEPERPTVAGVALKAADTGRVLMLQRGLEDEDDPAAGTWEFPGGHEEKGDQTSLHTGIREWEEETGHPFPEGGVVHHTWTSPNGVYQGHLVVIPEERAVQFGNGRQVVNPDNPDGDLHEQAAWWDPDHARKNPALREELKTGTPWKEIKAAGNAKTAGVSPIYSAEDAWENNYGSGFGDHHEELSRYKHDPDEAEFRLEHVPIARLRQHTIEGIEPMPKYHELNDGDPDDRERLDRVERDMDEHGSVEPGIAVHHNGHYLVLDGRHRAAVAEQRGHTHLPMYVTDSDKGKDIFKNAATADPLYGLEEASPLSPPQHSNATNPASTGWATTQDPHSWDEPENNSTNLGALPGDGFLGSLHDEPEAALPSTDGAESELDDERQDAGLGQYDENDAELTPNTTLASTGSAQDIVARFQATAAAAALGGGKDGSRHAAQQASNKEIATAAKEFLSKKALKDFNYAEQQELINEGARDKTMARNSDVLNIEGTHYLALEAAFSAEEALESAEDVLM